jgi:thiol-disulfide isomerase/thioredoxin
MALLALAAACSGGSALNAGPDGSSGNTVERVAATDRGAPLTVSGTTLDGAALSTASYRGQVVVLNYWGSWCQPCIKETPDLKAAWAQLQGKNVKFLGLDAQESAQTGAAYMSANGLTYPSLEWDGGKFLLQLKGKAPAPPVTIVLDQQGRLAARVLAPVSTTTLVGLVDDVLNGSSQ